MFFLSFVGQTRLAQSLAAAVAMLCFTGVLRAAEPSALPIGLAEAQRLALARSQPLMAQDALARAARDMAVSAGQRPDPVLKLGIDNLPVSGGDRFSVSRDFMTMRRIGLVQELPREEKRRLKTERFERDAQRAEAQRQLVLAGLQRDTALAWLERYYTQAMRQLLAEQLAQTRLQTQAADIAFRAGRGTQADAFAARAAVLTMEDRLSQTDRQAANASLMLARWVGTDDAARPIAADAMSPAFWDSTALGTTLSTNHLRQHPQLAVLAAQLEAAQTEARLAQANTQSDWTLEAAYQQRGSSYSNMVSLGVSVPLQWDPQNRQNRETGARLALVDEARANHEDMLRTHEAEVRTLLNDWQSGKHRLARYRQQLLPVAGQRLEAALTAYRTGKADLGSALAARRDEIDTRLQALTLELETARLWAQLNYLLPDNTLGNPASGASPALPSPTKGQP